MSEDLTVGDALARFYEREGIDREAFGDTVHFARLGPLRIPFPNLRSRRRVLHLHDINHLLLGQDTSWAGEGEVAAWELASGFPRSCFVGYLYAPFALVLGLLVSPRRALGAYRRGRGRKNACHAELPVHEILGMRFDDLVDLLDLRPDQPAAGDGPATGRLSAEP